LTKYLLFATTKGIIKKTKLEEFTHIRPSGLVAIKLDRDDQLLAAVPMAQEDEVLLISASGKSIRFKESDVRATGRATRGVKGIKLKDGDRVVSVQVLAKNKSTAALHDQFLIVTENGYGKRTNLSEYSVQGRGGQGVYTAKVSKKTGSVVGAYLACSKDIESDLLIISREGKMIRLPLGQVSILGRHTQGVRLFRLDEGDVAVSMTLLSI